MQRFFLHKGPFYIGLISSKVNKDYIVPYVNVKITFISSLEVTKSAHELLVLEVDTV